MEAYRCEDCRYFRRHYIMDAQGCTAIDCGHCTHPRLKSRKPDTPACGHFDLREEQVPMSRHYLTMEILHWLQTLELPPEVRRGPME